MSPGQKIIRISVAAFLLAGCSDTPAHLATEPDLVSMKLAQAADKASRALDTIAHIDQQRNPSVQPMRESNVNPASPLMQPVSLRWSGPIEQISRVMAERAGMRFRALGREPGVPITVSVDVYQQPIFYVLRDVGLQAGSKADVSIDQNDGVVEVRYAASDTSH
jgi:defect-in-organelle-trafficking protein DotD